MRIGINGFGRIGRNFTKALIERHPQIQIVALNDLTSAAECAHLFKYDSNYGTYAGTVTVDGDAIAIDRQRIQVLAERDPGKLPWKDLGVDVVIESTGLFTDTAKARAHIDGGGAKKVVISAPAKGEDVTIVLGVNDDRYDPVKHNVISNASCTTNCLATAVKPIVDELGWVKGFMTTIHSYTNDQNILDAPHKDLRRARNAATNIIPTSTGAAKALYLTIPEVEGTFDGFALRVPTPTVSMIYLVAQTKKPTTKDELNAILRGAAEGKLKQYVQYTEEELVSSDFKKNSSSSIVDGKLTNANGDLVQIAAWYDNEWGYSCRLADLTAMILEKFRQPRSLGRVSFRKLSDLDVHGKRVLVRDDLNVPMSFDTAQGDGVKIADYTRIDAAIPTLRWLREQGARVVVLSHLGRPDGKPNPNLSLRPVAKALSDRLGISVAFCEDCVGEPAERAVAALHDGDVLLLENVRFHPEEERNDPAFAARLAKLGDVYVNDAFGTAHRAHASTEGVAHLLPNAAGLLMEAELTALARLIHHPAKPFVCAIGGAKVADKIGVFTHLIELAEAFCIGGGMANTFLAARGVDVGKSLRDDDLDPAKHILEIAQERHVDVHLPIDAVVAPSFDADEDAHVVPIDRVGHEMILDIGPESADAYARVIAMAKTIVFNGPMGVYEKPAYRHGTEVIGNAIARATANGAVSVVGGGDAAAAAHMLGFADKVTHVSTGGGATLEYLEGKTLPGVAALEH